MGTSKLKEELVKFFEDGIKTEPKRNLGLEEEHFIVYEDSLKSVPYEGSRGVKYIIEELMKFYPNSKRLMDDDIIGFSTDNFNITLEPAAQVEISIAPFEDIKIIDDIYSEFLYNIGSILSPLKYRILPVGCQPVSKTEELNLIPKKRYHFMERYYKSIGTEGTREMKGTCSTQVSIDYFSEKDFRRKIQAAYLLAPVLKLISNNSKYFEGRPLNTYLQRTILWNDTDPIRYQIPSGIFSDTYSFEEYANHLCKVPPIYINNLEKNTKKYTGSLMPQEVFSDKTLSKDDILHMVAIIHLDVRLKNYLEIRVADAMPKDYILAYCSLIKGLIYSDDVLDWCQDLIHNHNITVDDINKSQEELIKYGWDGSIYGVAAKTFADEIIKLAESNLSEYDHAYLEPFKKMKKVNSKVL